ncbi:hypothetical protein [Casimicrobium huifangae]|jgi:hypothetical protein|uniref:hypothetical protein n=1 Tax=Casimicrobium huifangae TaxID=2591109 RepID=UPI0012EB902E|nr:hypothetical protein [Casimicrobium huifangae]
MSNALQSIREQGFELAVSGDRLTVSPASRLNDEWRAFVRDHKAELIAALAIEQAANDTAAIDTWPQYLKRLSPERIISLSSSDGAFIEVRGNVARLHEETPETVADIWADTVKTHGAALAEHIKATRQCANCRHRIAPGRSAGYCTSDERADLAPSGPLARELPDDNGLNCAAFERSRHAYTPNNEQRKERYESD